MNVFCDVRIIQMNFSKHLENLEVCQQFVFVKRTVPLKFIFIKLHSRNIVHTEPRTSHPHPFGFKDLFTSHSAEITCSPHTCCGQSSYFVFKEIDKQEQVDQSRYSGEISTFIHSTLRYGRSIF